MVASKFTRCLILCQLYCLPSIKIQYNTIYTTVHRQINDTHLITKLTLTAWKLALCKTEEVVLSAIQVQVMI